MSDYTQEQIDAMETEIKEMGHYALCTAWRFSSVGDPRFRSDLITSSGKSLGDIFSERLRAFGGFTPEISKAIGF